jgi:hypothetical protein
MQATYIDRDNVEEQEGDTYEVRVSRLDLAQAEQARAKLYLEVDSLTDTPRFYWAIDSLEPVDFPVAAPSDFIQSQEGAAYTVTVNVGDQMGERPS